MSKRSAPDRRESSLRAPKRLKASPATPTAPVATPLIGRRVAALLEGIQQMPQDLIIKGFKYALGSVVDEVDLATPDIYNNILVAIDAQIKTLTEAGRIEAEYFVLVEGMIARLKTHEAALKAAQEEVPELERPSKLQANTDTPSRAGAPSKFRHLVEGSDPKLRILCNRPMNDKTIPLPLHHQVFGQFVEGCKSFKPGQKENAFVSNLSLLAGYFDSETERKELFNAAFADYYKFHLLAEEIPGTNRPTDGHAYVTDSMSPKKQYIYVIAQGKNEITQNTTDPRFQAILYYREHARRFFRPTFQVSCLPAILITYYAANIQVSGVITHPDGTVQSTVLTPTFCLDADWRDDEHWTMLARCLGALKNTFEALSTYYKSLPEPPTPFQVDHPPMNFPYPKECEGIKFKYIDRVYPNRLIFSAREDALSQRRFFIKFSKEYSVDAHRLLFDSGYAPKLYAYSRLPGGWIMVVMEEMERPWVVLREVKQARTQFREAIEKAIESLHANGYVHGDIRTSNVFVCPEDPSRGVKFIDFDEAGVDGEALYPRNLNTETVRRPPGAVDGDKITKEHDKFMIKELFVQPYDAASFNCWAIGCWP